MTALSKYYSSEELIKFFHTKESEVACTRFC
jgi:hypothetical protein